MSVATTLEAQGDVLHLTFTGRLNPADYEQFVPAVDAQIAARERVHLLIELRDFHGWTAGALWNDLKFGIKHFNSIDRIAIVGEKPWQRGLSLFCKPFSMARIRYFTATQLDAARAWLGEGHDRPPSGHPYDLATAPKAVAELLRTMDGKDGVAREKARAQLVAMGSAAIPHLVQAAQGGRFQLRLEATRALAKLGDQNTAEALARQFDDCGEIGWAAAEGLKNMGSIGARAVLQQLMMHPGSHGVRIAAHHALREAHDSRVLAAVAPVVAALADSAPASEAPVAAFAALQQLG